MLRRKSLLKQDSPAGAHQDWWRCRTDVFHSVGRRCCRSQPDTITELLTRLPARSTEQGSVTAIRSAERPLAGRGIRAMNPAADLSTIQPGRISLPRPPLQQPSMALQSETDTEDRTIPCVPCLVEHPFGRRAIRLSNRTYAAGILFRRVRKLNKTEQLTPLFWGCVQGKTGRGD